jgi:glycosyltransferase involved in cell wall biosynthesis
MSQTLTIIIPCYNEELLIEKTYQRVNDVMNSLPNIVGTILFINDGSKDKTAEKLNIIASNDAKVQVIHFSRNFGHQPAVTAGINNTLTDLAIIIDADLQDPPELFGEMLDLYNSSNCNSIFCVRNKRRKEFVPKGGWSEINAELKSKDIWSIPLLPFVDTVTSGEVLEHDLTIEFSKSNETYRLNLPRISHLHLLSDKKSVAIVNLFQILKQEFGIDFLNFDFDKEY